MSRIVNLNKARKALGKARKRSQADENAVKFGRTKAEKQREAAQSGLETARLDGHKREP
ncbi:DUF4169 family protein [Lacimonas salitolerans]|uniref:DUF4169 family protein n=1 Tax=Lacimonas salitolerans TaxID=1323750 RepID=A0ABW4EAX7_9RHOB